MTLDDPIEEQDWVVQFEASMDYISSFIDGVTAIRGEGQIIASETAFYSDMKDATNVALTISKIESGGFDDYKFRGEERFKIGIDFEKFEEMVNGINSTSSVRITYPVDNGGAHYLHIDVLEDDLQLLVPLLDKDSVPKSANTDPISSDTRVSVDGKKLKEAAKHCKKVKTNQNNAVSFKTSGNKFILQSSDSTEGSVSKEFIASGPQEEGTLPEKETEIGLGYLDDIKGVIGSAEEVTVHVDDEYPVRVDCQLDDEGDAMVIYIIAPRVSDE